MAALDHWYAALRNCTETPAHVLLMGDSILEITRGPSDEAFRIPRRLGRALQERYMGEVQGLGYVPASPPTAGTPYTYSTAVGSLPISSSLYGLSRYSYIFPPLTVPATASITQRCDRFWVIGAGSGLPSLPPPDAHGGLVSIDGGEPVEMAQRLNTWGRVMFDSGPLSSSEHTIVITGPNSEGPNGDGPALYLEGIFFFDGDYDAGVHVWESAVAGTAASYYLNPAAPRWADVMDTINPDLVVIEFGINEMVGAFGNGATPAQFATNLAALVTKINTQRPLLTLPSVALMPMWAIGTPPWTEADWVPYHQAMVDLAYAQDWAIVADIYELVGWIGATDPADYTTDGTHPNDYNGKPLIVDALMTDLTSAVTPVYRSPGYVTVDEIRALPNLGDVSRFTDDELEDARTWFETIFEDYTGMAFVPRAATERLDGRCSTIMLKHWPVRSITAVRSYTTATVSTAFTADELADLKVDPTGEIRRYSLGYWPADVEIDYVHGQAAPPADVKKAALIAIQERLMEDNSGRPADRTYGTATDGVFVRSILPGKDKPYGLTAVDEVANRYRAKYKLPGMA